MYKGITLFLLLVCHFSFGQKTVKTRVFERDTFPTGQIRTITVTKIKETGKYGIHTYQKATEIHITRYRIDGSKLYTQYSYTKIGVDTAPCKENIFIQKEYFPNGKLKTYWEIECDCHKIKYREYNENGKLLNKSYSVIKRYY